MNGIEKEQLINRICSGLINLDGHFFKWPSFKKRYKSDLIYQQSLNHGITNEENLSLLKNNCGWVEDFDKEIEVHIPKVMEQLKLDIYNAYLVARTELPELKNKLKKVKERLFHLLTIKRSFYDYTEEGIADKERLLYLMRECTDNRLQPEILLSHFHENQIADEKIRELARSSEWSTKWLSFKKGFKVFSGNFNPEQELLVKWSTLYDNILEQPDCPKDEIIEDDDAFDGWMIFKRKEILRNKGIEELDKTIKDKNAKEVYKPVDKFHPVFEIKQEHIDEARRIAEYNDSKANSIKLQRFKQIQEKGIVAEYEVKDGKLTSEFKDNQVELLIARNNGGKSL